MSNCLADMSCLACRSLATTATVPSSGCIYVSISACLLLFGLQVLGDCGNSAELWVYRVVQCGPNGAEPSELLFRGQEFFGIHHTWIGRNRTQPSSSLGRQVRLEADEVDSQFATALPPNELFIRQIATANPSLPA